MECFLYVSDLSHEIVKKAVFHLSVSFFYLFCFEFDDHSKAFYNICVIIVYKDITTVWWARADI